MVLCDNCWKEDCNCSSSKISIDDSIADTIRLLNLKGYKTLYCCGGHINIENIYKGICPSIYIFFNKFNCKNIYPSDIGDGWTLTKTDLVLRYTFDECKKYKRYGGKNKYLLKEYNHILTEEDISDLENKMESKRKELNLWANNL